MRFFGNGRGVGITEALHNSAEEPVILLFAVIPQLGDVWFLFLLGGSLYVAGNFFPRWKIDRRRGLFVLALVLTYVALIGSVKAVFQLPRPPGAGTPPELVGIPSTLAVLVDNITTAESPGFPSGHALGSTMVWGGLTLVLEGRPDWRRYALAGGVILLISFSRLILGVHYLIDVIAGMFLGVLVLGVFYWLAEKGTAPDRALLVAVGVGVIGLFVGVTFDSVAATGGAVGGWLAWRVVAGTIPAHPTTKQEVVAAVLAFGAAAGILGGLIAVKPPLLLTFIGAAVSASMAVGAPLVGEQLA